MFEGMPRGTFEFFERLKKYNTTDWWQKNRTFYVEKIAPSFGKLLDGLGPTYGPWRTYRPRNDTRFAKDKPPYKPFIGAVTMMPSGTGHFVQFRATGLLIGSGYAMMAKDQLAKFRQVVADDITGKELYEVIEEAERTGLRVTAGRYERLKSAPRGFSRDHPRIHWLRARGLDVSTRAGRPNWVYDKEAIIRVRDILESSRRVTDWLDANVGPSTLTQEEIWAPRTRKKPMIGHR